MQDNAAQETGGKVQYCQQTQFQVHQLLHPDFFVEDSGRNPHHSYLMKILAIRMANHPLSPFPILTYYYYFHSLVTAFACQCSTCKTLCHQHNTELQNSVCPPGLDHGM